MTIRREKQIETVNIINLGEVDFTTGEKLKEISFSSFFPAEYDPSYCRYSDLPDPQEAMNLLTKWTQGENPVRLIITTTIINTLVLVTAHVSTFKGGEPGDVYYDLTLRTWRQVKVRTAAEAAVASAAGAATRARPDTKPVPKVYVVKSGDSLWKIAKLNFGDGSKWKAIYDLNRKAIGPDPNKIKPGMKLVMPA